MRLNEIFTDTYEWNKTRDGEMYSFDTQHERTYRVYFDELFHDNWAIGFSLLDYAGDSLFGIYGIGDQYKVFSTVIDIILDFKKSHTSAKIGFTSSEKEPSRTKLYNRMVKTLTQKYGMSLVQHDPNGRYVIK